jgi:RNA-binding protein
MEEIGEIMHIAKSGRLIIRLTTANKETKSGEFLVDENGKRIGKVIEVIGPVKAPYASVVPLTERTDRIIGIKVFSGGFLRKRRGPKQMGHRQSKGLRHNDR